MKKDREVRQGETTGVTPKFSSAQNKKDLEKIFGNDPKLMYPRRNRRVTWTEGSISILKSPALGDAPGKVSSFLTRGAHSDRDETTR